MLRKPILLALLLAGCSKGPTADLQYIKQARSLAAEWALVNEQANAGKLTLTYVNSMRRWVHTDLEASFSSLTTPGSPYGREIRQLLIEPPSAAPEKLRAHGDALKRIEDELESA
jgi:hypothetical protein